MRNLATDPLRVAVIGLGRWGFTLGGVAAKTPGLALTTCFTRNRAKREEFAALHRSEEHTSELQSH